MTIYIRCMVKILEKSAGLFSSWNLREYGSKDVDGSQPGLSAVDFEVFSRPKTQYRWIIQEAS